MLTPSSGIVRTNPELTCAHCKQELRNFARYPHTGVSWRCVNRECHGAWNYRGLVAEQIPQGGGRNGVCVSHASIFSTPLITSDNEG